MVAVDVGGGTMGVGVRVGVAVRDGVAVVWLVVITSCGELAPDSRLEKEMAVPPEVVRARLSKLVPEISPVTSTSFQVLALTAPVVANTLPGGVAFAYVMPVSLQAAPPTGLTAIPTLDALFA